MLLTPDWSAFGNFDEIMSGWPKCCWKWGWLRSFSLVGDAVSQPRFLFRSEMSEKHKLLQWDFGLTPTTIWENKITMTGEVQLSVFTHAHVVLIDRPGIIYFPIVMNLLHGSGDMKKIVQLSNEREQAYRGEAWSETDDQLESRIRPVL